jgi:hypothetical protein
MHNAAFIVFACSKYHQIAEVRADAPVNCSSYWLYYEMHIENLTINAVDIRLFPAHAGNELHSTVIPTDDNPFRTAANYGRHVSADEKFSFAVGGFTR